MSFDHAAAEGTQSCAIVRNDDTPRPYDPRLHEGFVRAFHLLFSRAKTEPGDALLRTGVYRCANGHALACFVGANLACGKVNTARNNPGAEEYCRSNPDAADVPMFATGHDTIYAYACLHGRTVVKRTLLKPDRDGFASSLWAPMD
jgi:hypothetical protein